MKDKEIKGSNRFTVDERTSFAEEMAVNRFDPFITVNRFDPFITEEMAVNRFDPFIILSLPRLGYTGSPHCPVGWAMKYFVS